MTKKIIVVTYYDCPSCGTRYESIEEGFYPINEDWKKKGLKPIYKCEECGDWVDVGDVIE